MNAFSYKHIIFFIPLFYSLTVAAQADTGVASGANPYTASTVNQYMPDDPVNGCQRASQVIRSYCNGNPDLALAQQRTNWMGMQKSKLGVGDAAQNADTVGKQTLVSISQIQAACSAATDRCLQLCRREQLDHTNKANQYLAMQPPQTQSAQQESNQSQSKQQLAQTCQKEQQTLAAKASSMKMNIGEVLAAVASIMQSLGIGKGSGKLSGLDKMDDCEGENAKLLIKCNPDKTPSASRAGLNGVTNLSGKTSNSANPFDGSISGEPGGTSDGSSNSSNSNPFNSAGYGGGFGSSGFGNNSAATTTASKKSGSDLDTNVNNGYMGTGGFSSGGGGGSGSSGGFKAGSYSSLSPLSKPEMSKAALQKKLSKYAGSSSRMPASNGGTNGPFEDNWSVINKAYKKNSGSMFHQQ